MATKRRVFLSFRAEDRLIVQGLRLLAANPEYDLDFFDESVRVAIDSSNADYVKRVIREKLDRTSVTVCCISELTHTSRWVDWELAETDIRHHPIIAMALKGIERAVLPALIKEQGLAFHPWNPANLGRLINAA